jgi:hypothetical protein
MSLFKDIGIETIFLAEIARLEFSSAVWKKCRKNEIDEGLATQLIAKFELDAVKFTFIPESQLLRQKAKELIGKYWRKGLRT